MREEVRRVMDRHFGQDDEPPPTLGVREPRHPKPPTLSPGYALEPPTPDAPPPGEDSRVTMVVSR
jgi:hypothetical protein